jgi:predicted TIM-barrel fold metal-dependent hydrolase
MSTPTKIIDTHQHVFWQHRNDADLVADMDAHGIERAWLLTWEIPPGEDSRNYHRGLNPQHGRDDTTHAGIVLDDILRTRDRFPDRFIAGYCPPPLQTNAADLLYSAAHIHDVKICGEWKFRILIDDPHCLELFHVAGELKMPVVLHLDIPYLPTQDGSRRFDPLWYGGTVDNLERALQACPDTTFIGHAPGFWREISGDAGDQTVHYGKGPVKAGGKLYRLFEEYSNLYADLSAGSGLYALARDPAHAVTFLSRFADKLVFGRDYYGQELHEFLQTLVLPQEAVEKIYWQNAEGLLQSRNQLEKPAVKKIFKS